MEKRVIKRTGKEVSLLGFGCWGIGKSDWMGADDKESLLTLRKAIDEGVTFFDTALAYGNGHSEQLVGTAEKESGKNIFIASKIPSKKNEWPADINSTLQESFPKQYIIDSTEKSLKNLKRDYIDLMQFHVWNDKWADQDEWKEAICKLKEEGKVLSWGISVNDHQPENGIKAAKTGLIEAIQVIFNLFEQKPIDRLFPFAEKNNIAIIARVPFDEGALTGNIDPHTEFPVGDWRREYFRDKRRMEVKLRADEILKDVKDICGGNAEAALRFVISFKQVTTVIPGMRRTKSLLANLNYIKKGGFTPQFLEKLKVHRWEKNFYD